jgi:hypothetical protein
VLLLLVIAGGAAADDSLVERWDKPKRESFALAGAPPEKVAEEIRKRYGIAFEAEVKDTGPSGFEVKDAMFLEALDRFAAAQGLSLVGVPVPEELREHEQEALALVRPSRPHGKTPVAYVGPSRLSVQGLAGWTTAAPDERIRTARVFTAEGPRVGTSPLLAAWSDLEDKPEDVEQNEEASRLHVVFKWIAEPGFEELLLVRLKVAAEDDAGRALRVSPPYVFDPPDAVCADLPLNANRNFSVHFDPPSTEARAIGKMVVVMKLAQPVERSRVEFLAKDVGTTKQLGGCKVTFVEAKGVLTRFAFDGVPCIGILPTGTFASSGMERASADQIALFAYDADGQALEEAPHCGGTASGTRATYWEEWNERPARFTLEAVTKVAWREATFAFADIPLPE